MEGRGKGAGGGRVLERGGLILRGLYNKQNVAIMENMMNYTSLKQLNWVVLHIE